MGVQVRGMYVKTHACELWYGACHVAHGLSEQWKFSSETLTGVELPKQCKLWLGKCINVQCQVLGKSTYSWQYQTASPCNGRINGNQARARVWGCVWHSASTQAREGAAAQGSGRSQPVAAQTCGKQPEQNVQRAKAMVCNA